jgi:hypothetical protein
MLSCGMYGKLGWMVPGGDCGAGVCGDRGHVSRYSGFIFTLHTLKLIK